MYYFPNRLMDDDRQHQTPPEEPTTPETEPRETVEEPSTETADP